MALPGADPGGGGPGKKNPGIHFYSGFREKKHKGGGCNSNPKKSRYRLLQWLQKKNPGRSIHFYGGLDGGVPNSVFNKKLCAYS